MRSTKAAWEDLWHVSGVEKRVADYKNLCSTLEQNLHVIEEILPCLDELMDKIRMMQDSSYDCSEGPLIETFEEILEEVRQDHQQLSDYMSTQYEELMTKKQQAEIQLEYYQSRDRYENTLERELYRAEYDYNG